MFWLLSILIQGFVFAIGWFAAMLLVRKFMEDPQGFFGNLWGTVNGENGKKITDVEYVVLDED